VAPFGMAALRRVSVNTTSAPSAKILHRPTGGVSVLSAAAAVTVAAQRRAVLLGGGGYMTAPAPLVPGRWEGVSQDDGTGDWRAGNDHGRRCDRLNSQRRSPVVTGT